MVNIVMAQFEVKRKISENLEHMISVLSEAKREDWVVFPEGALSGYFPGENDFPADLDLDELSAAVENIKQMVKQRECHCLFGSVTHHNGNWHNSTLIASYSSDEIQVYNKVELSRLDQKCFVPGDRSIVPVYRIGGIKIGIQMCRELIFPLNWHKLKEAGAQAVFHINNAVNPYDEIWKHLFIARAVENLYYVCSVNNAASPQTLPSVLVSPSGHAEIESKPQTEQVLRHTVQLGQVVDNLRERTDF